MRLVTARSSGSTYDTLVGDGTATTFTVTHGLGTEAVIVQTWLDADLVLADVAVLHENAVEVTTAPTVPAADQLWVRVTGWTSDVVSEEPPEGEDLGSVQVAWQGAVQ